MVRVAEPNEPRIIPQSNAARGAEARGVPRRLTVIAGTGDAVPGWPFALPRKTKSRRRPMPALSASSAAAAT